MLLSPLERELLQLEVDAFHRSIVFRSVNVRGAGKSIDDIPLSAAKVLVVSSE